MVIQMPHKDDQAEVCEFYRGLGEGRDRNAPAPAPGVEAVTTPSSKWFGLLCPESGHTFRRGDRVRFGAGFEPHLINLPQETPSGDVTEFLRGLEKGAGQTVTPRRIVAPGDPLLGWIRGKIPRRRCAICGHTIRPYEIVVTCPCEPRQPLCELPVHQDPSRSLACYDAWREFRAFPILSGKFPAGPMTERFARHSLIPDWRQDRLGEATIVVAGVGALGNFVAQSLALAGVGRLILCDPDIVAVSNLSRTPLFTPGDVGRLKVEAAAERLTALAPELAVDIRAQRFEAAVGLGELRDSVSLVMGCLDSRSARLELAGRCALVRAPSIDAATEPWGGEVRPYLEAGGPCFACGLTPAQRSVADTPWSCLDASDEVTLAAAAPSSGLIGSWAALLAVRALSGAAVGPETVVVSAATGEARKVSPRRDPHCPLHKSIEETGRLPLGAGASLGEICALLPEGAQLLLWRFAESEAECRVCGFREQRWREAWPRPCPSCGAPLLLETTLETSAAPGDVTLTELGVPEREILAVRTRDGYSWIELC